ncbi:helix-turn-helix domain-containing protein [Bacillus cereus group sp. MYBK95-2]|uniref:helix-turn-helix domain-containing protein n=1 Tax=Bacillus cereus group sp. MYBK95-2 TaxID=3450599 RepID=UPI003F79E174
MDTLVIFSNTLKRLRGERGLHQQDVADDLVMTRERLSSYENNHSSPNQHALAQFAKYYEVFSDYLHRSLLDILSVMKC